MSESKVRAVLFFLISMGFAALMVLLAITVREHLKFKAADWKERHSKPDEPLEPSTLSAQRQAWADKYPAVRKVLGSDPNIGIYHYTTGWKHWQIMDGVSHAVCYDGGYGNTVQEAAADCLAHPQKRFPDQDRDEY